MARYLNNQDNWVNRLVIWLSKYRKLSPYIFAQARLESANFTSNIYRKNNNAFGMTHPTKRPSLGDTSKVYESNGTIPMQAYRNDTQSFRDFILYLKYFNYPTTVSGADEYVKILKSKGYFTAPESDYLKGLKSRL